MSVRIRITTEIALAAVATEDFRIQRRWSHSQPKPLAGSTPLSESVSDHHQGSNGVFARVRDSQPGWPRGRSTFSSRTELTITRNDAI